MSQCAVLIYTKIAADRDDLTMAEREAHGLYADDVIQSGAMVAAFALHPAAMTATSIRSDAITDGPFIDSKEVVASFYVIEVPDLDAALEIARRPPIIQQGGGVEVRPVEGDFLADRAAEI